MQSKDLIQYIREPALLDRQSVEQLQKLAGDFPYFQSAHLLLSMASKKWDASVYQQSLKKTAIVAPSRSHLFNLIQQVEMAMERVVEKTAAAEPVTTEAEVLPPVKPAEESRQELDILKAAEISTEQAVAETTAAAEEKTAPDPEAALEKEIQKSVVNSFVEKKILKTPELHKPKPSTEPGNFVEWLALIKKNNGQPNQVIEERPSLRKRETPPPVEKPAKGAKPESGEDGSARKEKQKAIIDRIIEHNPGIIRGKEDQKFFQAEIKAKESLLESEHLVTETLARIYALQGSVNKAVRAYEILSLKYPQKSAYFATLIQQLKNQ